MSWKDHPPVYYLLYTEEHGYETQLFPSPSYARMAAEKLRGLVAYRGCDVEIHRIDSTQLHKQAMYVELADE